MTRLPILIPITEAAGLKKVSRKTVRLHAKAERFDVLRIAGRTLIVDNKKWRAWQPNRVHQRSIKRGLRKKKSSE